MRRNRNIFYGKNCGYKRNRCRVNIASACCYLRVCSLTSMYCSFISICAVINEDFNVVSRSIQGFVGGVAILPCAPPTSTPKPAIRWVRRGSGNKVPDSSEVLPSGDLYLHSLSAGDSGQYRCVVVNTVLQERKRGPYLTLNVSSE